MLWLEAVGWEAGGCPTSSGASYVIGEECVFGFLWLILSQNWGQKLGELSVINPVLTILVVKVTV